MWRLVARLASVGSCGATPRPAIRRWKIPHNQDGFPVSLLLHHFSAAAGASSNSKNGGGGKKLKRGAMRRQMERDGSKNVSIEADTTYGSGNGVKHEKEQVPDWFYLSPSAHESSPARNVQVAFDGGTYAESDSGISSAFGTSARPTRLDLFGVGERSSSHSIDLSSTTSFKEQYHKWHPPTSSANLFLQSKKDNDGYILVEPTPDGVIEVDMSTSVIKMEDMYDPRIHLPYAPTNWTGYEPATPLSDYLMRRIGVTGRPITVAEYMRQALTHPEFGYYTNPPSSSLQKVLQAAASVDGPDDFDVNPWDNASTSDENMGRSDSSSKTIIGRSGDFVTAPEISHVFGHCLCVWFITQWQQLLRKPPHVQLVELGPGRGTLMVDILSLAMASSTMEVFGKVVHTVHLVEASPKLRRVQRQALLEGSKKLMGGRVNFQFEEPETKVQEPVDSGGKHVIRVQWHDGITELIDACRRNNMPAMVVGQEFIDALPVHTFERTKDGWRERLVDVVDREDNPPNPNNTPLVPRLRQVVAPGPTPAVNLLLESYEAGNDDSTVVPVGSIVEICPDAMFLMNDMATMLEDIGGVALFVDYGEEGTSDTARAFSNHKQVLLTSYPGQVDVTADVDFFVLKSTVAARHRRRRRATAAADDGGMLPSSPPPPPSDRAIHAFGPVPQGEFLMRMGVSDMVIAAIEKDDTTDEHAADLARALEFLVLPEHMGTRFKVLALAPKRDGIFAPAGMEG